MSVREIPQTARRHAASGAPTFGRLLRGFRKREGLTQQELADAVGMHRSEIGNLERGVRTRPYTYTIDMLAKALALSPTEHAQLSVAALRRPPESLALASVDALIPTSDTPTPAADATDHASATPDTDLGADYASAITDTDLDADADTDVGTRASSTIPNAARGHDDPHAAPPPHATHATHTTGLELWGWRIDILAALTLSVRWLNANTSRFPARVWPRALALAAIALVVISAAVYTFARVTPFALGSEATLPFASANARGWLIAERRANGQPAVLAVINAHTGSWRALWPDAHALSATQTPASGASDAPSLVHPHAPAYLLASHTLAFIASAPNGATAIWLARVALGTDGWPTIAAPGPSLALADCDGCGSLSWSPDGAWLVYDTQTGLRALAPATSETRALTTTAGDHWPACSPDGHWLAFQHGPGGSGSIVALAASDCLPRTDASARALYLNGYFPAWRPAWSLDSALLAFTAYATGRLGVVRVTRLGDLTATPDLSARTPTTALSPSGCRDSAWALGGKASSELAVFTCDNPSASQQHGTVVFTPGAMSPTHSWQAVADTGASAFQGSCWMAG